MTHGLLPRICVQHLSLQHSAFTLATDRVKVKNRLLSLVRFGACFRCCRPVARLFGLACRYCEGLRRAAEFTALSRLQTANNGVVGGGDPRAPDSVSLRVVSYNLRFCIDRYLERRDGLHAIVAEV